MFKTTMTGRTGGYVTYKKDIKNSNGKSMEQLEYTVFVRTGSKDKEGMYVENKVFCIQRGTDLSARASLLMCPTENMNPNNPKYVSRLVAIDGRINISERIQELPAIEFDEDKIPFVPTDSNGDQYTVITKAPSIVVFVDSFEVLDANPNKDEKKISTEKITDDFKSRFYKTKNTNEKEAKDDKPNLTIDIEEDEEEVLKDPLH